MALEGLRRLRAHGRFIQPASSAETIRRLIELSSPVSAFVQDCCELGSDKITAKDTLYADWRTWCQECGHEPGSLATFARNLMAAIPDIRSSRPRGDSGRFMIYTGIGLRRL